MAHLRLSRDMIKRYGLIPVPSFIFSRDAMVNLEAVPFVASTLQFESHYNKVLEYMSVKPL